MAAEEHHDVVVLGGGPAGVSAALECADLQLDVVLVETAPHLGGQLGSVPNSVRNVAAGRFADGAALRRGLVEASAILADQVRCGQDVTGVDAAVGLVESGGRRLRARALVVATGTLRQELAAAPEGSFGGAVTYQLESRAGGFGGQPVVVVGGGDSATLDALELARAGSAVTLVHRSPGLTARHDIVRQVRADPRIEDLAGWELERLCGGDGLEEVVVRNGSGRTRQLHARGVVVKIARRPSTALLEGQLDLDGSGAIVVDRDLRASAPGVFAAGDVVAGAYPRVATAMGHGVLAARSVLRHLEGGR